MKMSLEFEGFDELIARLEAAEGDVTKATEEALKKTHARVTTNAAAATAGHRRTGRMIGSLQVVPRIMWVGGVASVEVGFNIRSGGLPSIFLMYGTPRMRKVQKLYNAFYGSKTQKEIAEITEECVLEELRRIGG